MMTFEDAKKHYEKHIKTAVSLNKITMWTAFGCAFFLILVSMVRCSCSNDNPRNMRSLQLPVAPYPLNEWPESRNKPASEQAREWQQRFREYARGIKIEKAQNIQFLFKMPHLIHNNSAWGEVTFELYNAQQEYLFSFYADDFWNMSGYDDGSWHQINDTEKVTIQIPHPGTYYLVAGIPPKASTSTRNYVQNSLASGGTREVLVYLNEKAMPVNTMMLALGFMLFLMVGFMLAIHIHPGGVIAIMHHSYNFQSFDYIVKLPDSISSTPFLLTGYTKPKDGGDSIEFILEQEGQTSYLEIETEEEEIELESGKEYSRTVRYAYHYKPLSGAENPFKKFPTKECITYHKQAWTLESSGKSLDTANYMDGETETYKVTYRYYHNNKQQLRGEESDLLCFTHEGDIKDFDVCYGTYIDTPYDICIYELTKA